MKTRQSFHLLLLGLLPLCGLWFTGQSFHVHAKAILAQLLLESAWSATLIGRKEVKPWPWADIWPVARLRVPELGINHIVLAGATGSSLAFGPGHLFSSAAPGETGNVIISGHRDTHFAFLNKIVHGVEIILEDRDGNQAAYTVTDIHIIDTKITPTIPLTSSNMLTLITCYPFHAVRAGTTQRYIVIAKPKPITYL